MSYISEIITVCQPTYIGILGEAGAGKDTVGRILVGNYPDYSITKYAQPLKDLSRAVFGHADESLKELPVYVTRDGHDHMVLVIEEYCNALNLPTGLMFEKLRDLLNMRSLSPRYLQQTVGSATRSINPDAFVQAMINLNAGKKVIVTDVRYPNELCTVNIVVQRDVGVLNHESEDFVKTVLKAFEQAKVDMLMIENKVTVLVRNTGSLQDLRKLL